MATLTLPSPGPFSGLQVKLPDNLDDKTLLSFRPFQEWLSTLEKSLSQQQERPAHPFHQTPYHLRSVDIQAADFFGASRLGFLKLRATVTNDAGEYLPGAVFMRGAAVGMLIILSPHGSSAEDEQYVILTVQPRVAAGSLGFVELPAGMVDEGTFSGAAAREIKEETGLDIGESGLINMSQLTEEALDDGERDTGVEVHLPAGSYSSPGGCDEFIPLFLVRKTMGRKDIDDLKGKLTGLRDHGEKITVKVVKLRDVWKVAARDGKTLAALAMYDGLKRAGRLGEQ